jgi:hypothetical protein
MTKKAKKLCDWKKKQYSDDLPKLKEIVRGASHVCSKCGRAANSAKLLCSPEPIDAEK